MSDSETAQLISIFESAQVGSYFAVAAVGLFAYEYSITFGREIELFWKRKITVSSVLFVLNRYLPFLVNMIYAPWPKGPTTTTGCAALFYTGETLEIFQYLPWALFSGLRAYVLSSKTWPLAALVFLASIVSVVINYVSMRYATAVIDPLFGCSVSVSLSNTIQQNFTIVSRVCLIASDLLVLGITWAATYKTSREIKTLGQHTSLSSILFRDGVIYFIVLLIMNILHLSFSLLSILVQNDANNASYITILTEPITAILISRFLIDLQEANHETAHQHSLASVGTLNFNRVIGSLGSSLPAPGEVVERMDVGSSEVDDDPRLAVYSI